MFIVELLKRYGGSAPISYVTEQFRRVFGKDLRCLSSYTADCRKLGGEIRYDAQNETLTLVREPVLNAPQQRQFKTPTEIVHRLEESGHGPSAPVEKHVLLGAAALIRQYIEIPPYVPKPKLERAPVDPKLKSYRLFD